MTLQLSGVISISNCAVEAGMAANANVGLNDTTLRSLANVPSGLISLSNFYGKSWIMRWSGSTVVSTYYGIEVSGSSWRVPGGNWLTTYHDTFQSGSSYYGTPKTGLQASGNAIRNYTANATGGYSSTWIYWSGPTGFTGSAYTNWSSTTQSCWGLYTSGGSVRSGYSSGFNYCPALAYAAWVYLY